MKSQSHRFSNEKLLEILSFSQNATAIYTGEELTIQSANAVMLGYLGKDKSIIGLPLAEALPELEGQPFIPLLQEVWRTGVTYEAKNTPAELMVNGKLQTFYFDFTYRAIHNELGEVDSILHTTTDVTEINVNRNLVAHAKEQEEALGKEQALNEELASINEELASSNEELAATMEELADANQELRKTKDQLELINERLETRVIDRTITIDTLNQDLEAFNEELRATNEELITTIDDLASSENRVRSIIEAAPFPIGIYTGKEMRITFVNQSIIDVWGKGSDVVGKLYADVLPELDNQSVYDQLDKVFTTGVPFEARNQRIDLMVDGILKVYYFNYNFTPLYNEDGSIYGVMNTAADVTDSVLAKQLIEEGAEELASLNDQLAAINEELTASNDELASVNDKLSRSQDELEFAINAAGMATFDLNPMTGKFAGNDLLKSWFGLQPINEIPLTKATDVIAEEDRERVSNAIQQALDFSSGGDYDTYYTIIHPETQIPRIVRAKGKALFNEQQQAIRLSGVLQDVTEQVTAQDKMNSLLSDLESSEKRFRSLIKQAPVAINVFKTRELIIDSVNDKMLDIWGKTEAVKGKKFVDALPEIAEQPFIDILQNVFDTGMPYYGIESKAIILKDNLPEERYFNFTYQPVQEEDGSFDSILQVVTEVTEQVNARKEIADINTRLNIAIDAGELGSTEVDLATGTMITNAQFKKFFGRSEDEQFNYADLFEAMLPKHRERIKKLVMDGIENHTVYQAEYEVAWPDGSIHWLNAHGKARYDDKGKAIKIVGIMSDVTEFKADEQRKDDFIGMVSHELKTPLTSLTAYVQMLQAKAGDYEDSFISNALDMANKQVRKMTGMINGFLNISRLESGKIHIDSQLFDMAVLVKEVEQESIVTVTSHKVIFAPVEETFVLADKDKIAMVINNFISNAVKYSEPNTIINIACINLGNSVQVSVKDQGRGIKKEDQEKLFERYYRVKDQPVSIAGFGIGLYVCAEVIHRHNGKIWVESEEGKGATFYFTLPL